MPARSPLRWIWPVLIVLCADQASKLAIERSIPPYAIQPIIPGVFNFVRTSNTGVAFGLLANAGKPWVSDALALFSAAVMAFLAWMLLSGRTAGFWGEMGMAMILGGAAGNVLDRVLRGSVTDFIDVYWRGYHWPAFNVADSSIVIGAGLVLIQLFREHSPAGEKD